MCIGHDEAASVAQEDVPTHPRFSVAGSGGGSRGGHRRRPWTDAGDGNGNASFHTPRMRQYGKWETARAREREEAANKWDGNVAMHPCCRYWSSGPSFLPQPSWTPHPPSDSPSREHHSHPRAHIIQVEPRTPDPATETKGPRGAVPIKPSEQARGAEREPRLSVGFASA